MTGFAIAADKKLQRKAKKTQEGNSEKTVVETVGCNYVNLMGIEI